MIKLNFICLIPLCILIFIGMVIPSDGDHGVLTIKSLGFLFALSGILLHFMTRQQYRWSELRLLNFFMLALGCLFIWLIISLMRNETTAIARWDQFKLFVVTLLFPLMVIYCIDRKILTPQTFLKVVIYSSLTYALIKVLIVGMYLFDMIDIWKFLNITGLRFMSMKIYGGVDRMQTSVDIATPFLAFFVLQSKNLGVKLSRPFKFCYLILALCSTFLSFSRYLMAVYILSCLLHWITLDLKQWTIRMLQFCGLVCIVILSIDHEPARTIMERRVFSAEVFHSDDIRKRQFLDLLQSHQEMPFIGKGLGGYVQDNIRDPLLLHSYEVQWAAFLMQFGFIGILLILFPFGIIIIRFMERQVSITRLSFVCLFLIWMFSGMMNPFLISLTSGIIYAVFYLSADMLENKPAFLNKMPARI